MDSNLYKNVVYCHKRKDDGIIFYIGIGSEKRAYRTSGRTEIWKRIADKHGFTVSVTHKNLIWEEACVIEKYLVSFYGKINDGGLLCNITDGGEGAFGRKASDITKNKIRNSLLGRNHSEEAKAKMSQSRKGKPSSFKGKSFSEESKRKLSNSKKGTISPKRGIKLSEETIEKMRKSLKGRKAHPNTIEASRRYWTGRKHTMESRNKMSLVRTGEKRSAEAIANIVNAHLKYLYTIETPSGEFIEVLNLNKFCLEHNLTRSLLSRTHGDKFRNGCKITHHKNYKIVNKIEIIKSNNYATNT